MIGTRLGPYEIVAALGEGGMGAVYRARDTKLNRDVAIKVLLPEVASDPDRLARFRREAQVLAALNHPNIAHIHGIEEGRDGQEGREGHAETIALVMELVDGETLAHRVAQGPLALDEALPIAKQIADALEAAHEQGIIHRDLKPANIKIRPDGTVKVLDFGLAKAIESPGEAGAAGGSGRRDVTNSPTITSPAQMTRMGMVLGTAAYMSPEQARGRAVDRRADIWAFGCVLYEMLTGRRAFQGDDVSITLASVLKDAVDWSALPPQTPPSVVRLLRRCLEKDPRRRLSAIADARIELEDAAAPPVESAALPPARASSSRAAWIGAALLGALWIATLVPAFRYFRSEPAALQTVRFSISTGNDVLDPSFAVSLYPMISPDGKTLAFVGRVANFPQPTTAATSDGLRPGLSAQDAVIWIRPIDALAATALEATRGARFVGLVPFWSPDSRAIAFASGRTLYRVDIATGARQKICDIDIEGAISGAAWGADGTIVYADSATGSLFRVPATGGTPAKLFASADGAPLLRPTLLPDGKHVLYLVADPSGQTKLYLRSMDGGEPVQLTTSDSQAVYASGHLLFMRGRGLFAQAFDVDRGRLSGEPRLVADGVYWTVATRRGAFDASSTGTLIFRNGSPGSVTSDLAWFDRTGRTLATVGDELPYYQIRLSPDERRVIAVLAASDISSTRLVTLDLASGVTSNVSEVAEGKGANDPLWSPDSTTVALELLKGTKRDFFTKRLGNASVTPLYESAEDPKWLDDWSPDGRFVLFHEATGLSALPVSGERTPTRVVPAAGGTLDSAHFSHDGKWIAFALRDSGWQTWVASFPGAEHRRQISAHGGGQPWWRGDDKEIFYLDADGRMMSVAVTSDAKTGALDFAAPEPLFQSPYTAPPASIDQYSVTRDGKRFLFIRPRRDAGVQSPINVVVNWQEELKPQH